MGASRTIATRLAAGVLLAAMATTGAGCGGKKEAATSTTTKPASTTPTSLRPTTTLSDSGYDAFFNKVNGEIATAGKDPCKLTPIFMELSSGDGTPANPAQVKQAMDLTQQLFNAVADSAPASLATEAQTVRTGGQKVADAAKAAGYSMEWLQSPSASASFGPEFGSALNKIQTETTKTCKN